MRKSRLEQKAEPVLSLKMAWVLSVFTPKEPNVEKLQLAKPSEYWLPGCGSSGLMGMG